MIGGMTCASCAARVESRLNKLDGVLATVNYVTERARVTTTLDVSNDELVAAVAATGYSATVPAPREAHPQPVARSVSSELAEPRKNTLGATQVTDAAPGGEEHVLGDVSAEVCVPQERDSDRRDDAVREIDQSLECPGVAVSRRPRVECQAALAISSL
jgi:copper chaperone CopZ